MSPYRDVKRREGFGGNGASPHTPFLRENTLSLRTVIVLGFFVLLPVSSLLVIPTHMVGPELGRHPRESNAKQPGVTLHVTTGVTQVSQAQPLSDTCPGVNRMFNYQQCSEYPP